MRHGADTVIIISYYILVRVPDPLVQREELVALTYYILANFLCTAEHFKHSSFPCHLTKESVRCVHFMLFVMLYAFLHVMHCNIDGWAQSSPLWRPMSYQTLLKTHQDPARAASVTLYHWHQALWAGGHFCHWGEKQIRIPQQQHLVLIKMTNITSITDTREVIYRLNTINNQDQYDHQ